MVGLRRVSRFILVLFIATSIGSAVYAGSKSLLCENNLKRLRGFVPMLMGEGYSKRDAEEFLIKLHRDTWLNIRGKKNQKALEYGITSEWNHFFWSRYATKSLPILISYLPFKLDIGSYLHFLFEEVFSHSNQENNIRYMIGKWGIRYRKLWMTPKVPIETQQMAANRFLNFLGNDMDGVRAWGEFLENGLISEEEITQNFLPLEMTDIHYLIATSRLSSFSKNICDIVSPLRADGEEISLRLDSVRAVPHVSDYVGTCPLMTLSHRDTLGLNRSSDYQKTVLIYVEGFLIGALKMVGDNSLISLRNIQNPEGHLVLNIGGVYAPTRWVFQKAESAWKKSKEGEWPRIYLSKLDVRPIAFLEEDQKYQRESVRDLIQLRRQLE